MVQAVSLVYLKATSNCLQHQYYSSLTMYCAEEDDDMATTPIDQGLLVDAEKDIVSVTISGAIYIIDVSCPTRYRRKKDLS